VKSKSEAAAGGLFLFFPEPPMSAGLAFWQNGQRRRRFGVRQLLAAFRLPEPGRPVDCDRSLSILSRLSTDFAKEPILPSGKDKKPPPWRL
jgi:hypothetical protein